MNPNNKPDAFEAGALREIRDRGLKEYYELTDNGFRYARAVYQKASCIACHGDSEQAPNDVKVRYGTTNGFGFKEGDVAGIISVRLPARSFWDVALNVVGVWELLMIVAAFVIAMAFMYYAVVAPDTPAHCGHPADLARQGGRPGACGRQSEQRQRAPPARARDRAPAGVDQHGDPAPDRPQAVGLIHYGGVEMTNGKGGSFKGRAPKAPTSPQAPRGPQGRRPVAMPVMRIAPRGKSGGRGK